MRAKLVQTSCLKWQSLQSLLIEKTETVFLGDCICKKKGMTTDREWSRLCGGHEEENFYK